MDLGSTTVSAVGLWVGVNLLLMLLLGLNVTRLRVKTDTVVGIGEDAALERGIRAHGNNAEYVPGALIAIAMMAAVGYSATWIHALGGLLFVARLLHAYGIQKVEVKLPATRVAGNFITWGIYVVCSGALIMSYL